MTVNWHIVLLCCFPCMYSPNQLTQWPLSYHFHWHVYMSSRVLSMKSLTCYNQYICKGRSMVCNFSFSHRLFSQTMLRSLGLIIHIFAVHCHDSLAGWIFILTICSLPSLVPSWYFYGLKWHTRQFELHIAVFSIINQPLHCGIPDLGYLQPTARLGQPTPQSIYSFIP